MFSSSVRISRERNVNASRPHNIKTKAWTNQGISGFQGFFPGSGIVGDSQRCLVRGGVIRGHGREKGEGVMNGAATRRQGPADRSLFGLHQTIILLGAYAVLSKGSPLYTRRPERAGVHMTALLARGIRLVAPDLHLLAALLAPDLFRRGRPYLCAAGAAFFKEAHDSIIPRWPEKDMMQVISPVALRSIALLQSWSGRRSSSSSRPSMD